MAKLKSPLFSHSASGKLGDVLTFSQRSLGSQVRFQRPQKDYLSVDRVIPRKFFSISVGWWNQLSLAEQTEWEVVSRGEE